MANETEKNVYVGKEGVQKLWERVVERDVALDRKKVDKVPDAVAGNIPVFVDGGNISDSSLHVVSDKYDDEGQVLPDYEGNIVTGHAVDEAIDDLGVELQDEIDTLKAVKADKVTGATKGNLAGLDASGNLTDSGCSPSSFKTKQTAVADPSASGTTITAIATISQNANGVITATKKTIQSASQSQDGVMSAADKTKLDGIATGAEVNQNAFSNVKVGDVTVAADTKTDTLTLAAGSNVTITPDATNDKITIAAKDTTYTADAGIRLDGTVFKHTNSVSGGTVGPTTDTAGATLSVPYVTYDSQGHVTASGTRTHNVGTASTSGAGIVQLSSAIDSTSDSMAATPKAVKDAIIAAEQATVSGLNAENTVPDGHYITSVDETDGIVSLTTAEMDSLPTQDSTKPVKSGGVFASIGAEANDRAAKDAEFQQLIPTAASQYNQLADKAYVDAIGERVEARYLSYSQDGLPFPTYDDFVTAQQTDTFYYMNALTAPNNNDVIVITADRTHPNDNNQPTTTRWRFFQPETGHGEWRYEYTINNSALSEAQLLAINSGITAVKVGNYDAHLIDHSNPHHVTKYQVGLGNVDNTSDADKPISTATQSALDEKLDKIQNTTSEDHDHIVVLGSDGVSLADSGAVITATYHKDDEVNPVTGSAITEALSGLDFAEVGGAGYYISKVKQEDGTITATATAMDAVPTAGSTNAITSGAVKQEVDTINNSLGGKADKDADAVSGNIAEFDENGNPVDSGHALSEYKTKQGAITVNPESSTNSLTFLTLFEQNANGEITNASAATVPDASTSLKGVVQLTDSTSTASSTLAATATAVKAAYDHAGSLVESLNSTNTGTSTNVDVQLVEEAGLITRVSVTDRTPTSIANAIDALDATVRTDDSETGTAQSSNIDLTITQADGVLTGITVNRDDSVNANDVASAISDTVSTLDSTVSTDPNTASARNIDLTVTQENGILTGITVDRDDSEDSHNKVSSFQATPDDTHYPTEKLVKDSLDLKANKSEMTVTPGSGADTDKTTIQLKNGTAATVLVSHQDITGKADKVSGATDGNFAGLDANGNLTDSGSKASDFATAGHVHGNITSDGKIGTTADLSVVTTTAGEVTTADLTTADVSTSGTTLTAVTKVTQDSKGKVSVEKKTMQDGTTSQKGVVQLSSATDSDSEIVAATSKAVKDVMDAVDGLSDDKADKVSNATAGNFAGLDFEGNLTDSGKKASDFKTKQTAVPDPAASGNAISFIDTISQDTNGVITPTKKTVSLSSAVDSDAEDAAATPKAVKLAYEHADSVVANLDSEATSTDGTNIQVKVTQVAGEITAVNITTDNTESTANKVSSWSGTVDDTNYPTEKLVKDSLDAKANKSEMTVTPGTGANADKTTIQLKTGTSATVLTAHQDITGKADKVSGASAGNLASLDANGNLVDSGVSYLDMQGEFKPKQTAQSDPTASGNALSFIDTISQDEDGVITATKKNVTIDSALNSTSTNPVQNKAVDAALSGKADKATNLTGATKPKITYNSQGIVTAGADLVASDIPNLDASKITSGTLPVERGGTGSSTVEGARTNLDVYSKSEVDARLTGRIEVVSSLPTTGEAGVTYYVGPQGSGSDQYEEYIWAKKDGASTESWIKVGDRTIDLSGYKTKQTAKTSPTASGNTLSFIDTVSQNENGEITATKKTIQSASGTQDGVMSSSHYTKLEGISTGANKVEASTTNGNIKIDSTETTVYTHPTDGADTFKGDTTNQTPAFGGTFKVTSETVDAMGHTTVLAEHTVKIPNATAVASTGGTGGSAGLMSAADKEKLNGIATGAEANQNAFSNVKVGTATVAADSKTDTIEIATTSGKHIVLTADTASDKVTIDTDLSSKSAASGGTAESLVTTGEKYTWNSKASGTHTHGNITNDGKIGSTADLAVVTGTSGAVTTADLTTASPTVPTSGTTTSLEFIDTVAQNSKGKISATKKAVLVDSTYSATGTNPVNGKAIAAAIGGLDSNKASTDGTNVQVKVTETDGKISAVNITTDNTENRNNKVTAWSATTTDTHYPSEKLVKTSLDGKVDKVEGKGLSTEDYTTAEKTKLAGIAAGAEVNQNSFSNVKVGSTTVAADSKTDTLELASSSAITLTPDATNDKVTIGVSTMGAASSSAAGTAGIVPAPGAGKQASFLRGDGTWVVPTNTDTLVKATAKTDNVNYKILATASASPTSGNATEAVYDTDISLNPSTNTITSNISGNAATATKPAVTQLSSVDDLNSVSGSSLGDVLWYKWPSGSPPSNVPSADTSVMEVVRTHSNNYITQTVYTTSHSIYRRECVNGTWGAWYSYSKSTHTHGNITSGGALQTTDVAIANGDKLVITDASDSNKIARSSTAFDGSTITKALTQKGTFESVMLADDAMPLSATDGVKITYSGSTATISGNFAAGAGVGITYANNVATFSADISAIPLATIAALS